MLAYVSIGIAVCNIVVGLVFGLTWVYLPDEIRHSSLLQEEFRTAVRRLIVSISIFAIAVAVYLLEAKQSQNNAEPYAIVWGVCYVVSLLILLPSLATLIRDANRERKASTDSGDS
jgi:hypothetical protein